MNWPKDFINKVICGDCLEILARVPSNSIDMILTSPPYDDLRTYQGSKFDFEKIAIELFRILGKGKVLVWVVGDMIINGSESGTSFRQALYFKKIGFNIHDTMIYLKTGSVFPDTTRYYQVFEYMFILSKGKPDTFNPIKDRKNRWPEGSFWPSTERLRDGKLKRRNPRKNKFIDYGIRFNVWKYFQGYDLKNPNFQEKEHPAIFPEKLAEDHILSWSNEEDIVLDPMCGSGTTCKMAKNTNRRFIGIDISKDYCRISKERLAQGVL